MYIAICLEREIPLVLLLDIMSEGFTPVDAETVFIISSISVGFLFILSLSIFSAKFLSIMSFPMNPHEILRVLSAPSISLMLFFMFEAMKSATSSSIFIS